MIRPAGEKKKTFFLNDTASILNMINNTDSLSKTVSSEKSQNPSQYSRKYQEEQKRKATQYSSQISLTQARNLDRMSDSLSEAVIPSLNQTMRQTGYEPGPRIAYSAFSGNVKLNKEGNFLPSTNNYSSTELISNSGIQKVGFTDSDSTKASLLYSHNYSMSEPSAVLNTLEQRSLFSQIQEMKENKEWKESEEVRLKNPVYGFVKPPPILPRRGSQIVEDSLDYLMKLRSIKPVVETSVVFSPYDITSQRELEILIAKDKLKNESDNDYLKRKEKEEKTQNANQILKFLGMDDQQIVIEQKPEQETEETEEQKAEKEIKAKAAEDKSSKLTVADILGKMNSLTPEQQRTEQLNSARGANAKDAKANFTEGDKDVMKRKINLISEGIKKQMEIDKKFEEEAAAKAAAIALYGPMTKVKEESESEEEGDDKKHKVKVEQVLDRKVIRTNFRVQNHYPSSIIKKAFENQGKHRYVSKYLSQAAFDFLDGQEEDQDSTVLNNANYGQKVLMIESEPPTIKGIVIKGGKFRNPIFIDEDATEEETLAAKGITNQTLKQVESLRMREPAKIESKKEKELSMNGRNGPMPLRVPGSKWEDKMVQAGRRKVRFARDYDLEQFELEKGKPSIFKDPTFFENIIQEDKRDERINEYGNQKSSFVEQDKEPQKWNALDRDPQTTALLDVFEEQFKGGEPNDTRFQREQKQFARFKEKYIHEFERLDGFRYKYKNEAEISQNIRNEETYNRIVQEEEPKSWKPFDEPQTNPPEQLKDFQIEPNILVYCKNILDIDMDYKKNKEKGKQNVKEGRRQAQIGLTNDNVQGYQMQLLADNKDPNQQLNPPPLEEKQNKPAVPISIVPFNQKPLGTSTKIAKSAISLDSGGAAEPKQMTLAESILYFSQQQKLLEGSSANIKQAAPQVELRRRELFDFMFDNPASLPYTQMNKITRYVDDKEKVRQKLNDADQALYDATPMIPLNIFTYKSFFRLKEAEEYEKEMKIQLKLVEKPTLEQIKKEQAEMALKKDKAQLQINNMLAAMNPINFQFSNPDIRGRTILSGIEDQIKKDTYKLLKAPVAGQEKLDINKLQLPVLAPTGKDAKKPTNLAPGIQQPIQPVPVIIPLKSTTPGPAQKSQNSTEKPSSTATSKTQIPIPTLPINKSSTPATAAPSEEINLNGKDDTFTDYGKIMDVKTIDELNQMQSITADGIISKTQKELKLAARKSLMYQYDTDPSKLNPNYNDDDDDDDERSMNKSAGSNNSRFMSNKKLIKTEYYGDYGSNLTNTRMDYNIPPYYHNREAEQGLFYLSKNYRDYFEPARDVFAEKDGWDILNSFAHNPKNVNAAKPSVHTYGEAKKTHTEDDILTAFQGLKTMNEYNQLMKDVDDRNEQNLQRRIFFNQT